MPLCLHNTLIGRKEEFVPLKQGKAKIYSCGPTVYGRPHIGNYSSFLMADLLRRWLEVSGYEVLHVKNITDVGHMVADRDTGEDKVEMEARRLKAERGGKGTKGEKTGKAAVRGPEWEKAEGLTEQDVLAVARKYEEQYLEDEHALNLLPPLARPRASETIPEMLSLIARLMQNGHAYETADGVYFSVQSFPAYGALSGNTLDKLGELAAGVRVDLRESKKHPADFALWKKRVGENAKHVLHWDSPWGDGFPGWHIECSAMSTKFLGEEFDIHTGGEDNIFPHHECEIAQSEGAFGHPTVRVWLHKRRVNFADPSARSGTAVKMSKSLGNVLHLPDIIERGFDPMDLCYFFLSSHYRSHTTFTWKGLEDAKKSRVKIVEWMEEIGGLKEYKEYKEYKEDEEHPSDPAIGRAGKELRKYTERFTEAMDDDLNTPEALAAVFDLMSWSRRHSQFSIVHSPFLTAVRHTFGCFESAVFEIPVEVQRLVVQREEVRRAGDYATSDQLRRAALAQGFVLEDLPEGTRVLPKRQRS